jgi:hypothetical protein
LVDMPSEIWNKLSPSVSSRKPKERKSELFTDTKVISYHLINK